MRGLGCLLALVIAASAPVIGVLTVLNPAAAVLTVVGLLVLVGLYVFAEDKLTNRGPDSSRAYGTSYDDAIQYWADTHWPDTFPEEWADEAYA